MYDEGTDSMTEGERVRLYNDLCDYEQDLRMVTIPPRTREIDIINRAIAYVRGTTSKWIATPDSVQRFDPKGRVYVINMECRECKFQGGLSTYRICPQCGARMK